MAENRYNRYRYMIFTATFQVFPSDWMVLRVASCKVLLSALKDLAKPLLERFLGDEPPQFDTQVF